MDDARTDHLTHGLDRLHAGGAGAPAFPDRFAGALRRRRRVVTAQRLAGGAGALVLAASLAVLAARALEPGPRPEPFRPGGMASLARGEDLPAAASLLGRFTRGEEAGAPAAPLPADIPRAGEALWSGPERVAELAGRV